VWSRQLERKSVGQLTWAASGGLQSRDEASLLTITTSLLINSHMSRKKKSFEGCMTEIAASSINAVKLTWILLFGQMLSFTVLYCNSVQYCSSSVSTETLRDLCL